MKLCNTKYFVLIKHIGCRVAIAVFAFVLILVLPIAGGCWVGLPASVWTEFPPQTMVVQHAAFQWWIFVALGILIVSVAVAVVLRVVRALQITANWNGGILKCWNDGERKSAIISSNIPIFQHSIIPFPLWGWMGIGWLLAAWGVAWTRIPALAWLQHHTYVLVWLGYIVTVLALTQRRAGTCMLTRRPKLLAGLAVTSAIFWWVFEFLNRGVQNWFYENVEVFSPSEYALMATLSFMTVLPAVLATHDWLTTCPCLTAGLVNWVRIRFDCPRLAGAGFALAGAFGLFFLPVYPNALFPLLWIAPLALLCGLQAAVGEATLFDDLGHGDWRTLVRLSLAAIICGGFWEMWNMYSLARWGYAVPYVGRFHIFEMPMLGFAGYGPFGWECAAVAMIFGLWQPMVPKVSS